MSQCGLLAICGILGGWATQAAHAEALCVPPKSAGAHADMPASPPAMKGESPATARERSEGCQSCHLQSDQVTMHASTAVVLGCTDCHGGNASVSAAGIRRDSAQYAEKMKAAHVLPLDLKAWNYPSSAKPQRT